MPRLVALLVLAGVAVAALRPRRGHYSDCAVHAAPALPVGPCNCGGYAVAEADSALLFMRSPSKALH